jgi:hypothetical protein
MFKKNQVVYALYHLCVGHLLLLLVLFHYDFCVIINLEAVCHIQWFNNNLTVTR